MNPSVNISRYQRLDGTVLKLIACLSMFIDHLGAVCFSGMMGFRIIGRLAFPIYCFLLVEGAVHTRNMKKYILRMGIFALISEVPFDLAFYHRLVYMGHQNVFFTLGLGLLAIWFLEHPIEQLDIPDVLYKLLVIIAAGLIAEFFNTDYGFTGIAVICIFYYMRGQPQLKYPIAAILLAAMGGVEVYAVLVVLVNLLQTNIFPKKSLNLGFNPFFYCFLCRYLDTLHHFLFGWWSVSSVNNKIHQCLRSCSFYSPLCHKQNYDYNADQQCHSITSFHTLDITYVVITEAITEHMTINE